MRTGAVRDTVELSHGQTYRATVVESNEGGALLRIGGILIQAESEAPLHAGQSLLLRAEQMADTALALRIVVPEGKPQTPVVVESQLESVLSQMGLPSTPQNQAAVKMLLAWFQPVTVENVETLAREARGFEADRQEGYLNVRGWTKSVNLPEETSTLRVVTRFLLGEVEPQQVPLAIKHLNSAEHNPIYPDVKVLWWHSQGQHGEVYLFEDGKGSSSKQVEVHTLAIRIHTERLGELWVSFAYSAPELHLGFVSPQPDTLALMKGKQPALNSVVARLGMTLQGIKYRQGLASSFLDIVPPRQVTGYKGLNLRV